MSKQRCLSWLWVCLLVLLRLHVVNSLSLDNQNAVLQRRDLLWKVPLASVITYGYSSVLGKALVRSNLEYPPAHEDMVRNVIHGAVQSRLSYNKGSQLTFEPFRILEVGIGKDIRLVRRNLYDKAFEYALNTGRVSAIELSGVDLLAPAAVTIQEAKQVLQTKYDGNVQLRVYQNSITSPESLYPVLSRGQAKSTIPTFDVILCPLTLCSVADPTLAVQTMQSMLMPNGGTFAYVEHVAVPLSDLPTHRFLDWQQQVFDPLQQKLADNCHLHRNTVNVINDEFRTNGNNIGNYRTLEQDITYVKDMWPVTCQASGIIQRTA